MGEGVEDVGTRDDPDWDDTYHPLIWTALSHEKAPRTPVRFERGRRYPREQVEESQRSRLLIATAVVVARVGYANATIDGITTEAGVSKKTFYVYFSSKEDAFVSVWAAADWIAAEVIGDAVAAPGVKEKFDVLVWRYLASLAIVPNLTWMFLVEAIGASPRVRSERGWTFDTFVSGVQDVLFAARAVDPSVPDLTDAEVGAMIGGINELCVQHVIRHEAATLLDLYDPVRSFIDRLLGRHNP